MRVTNHTPISYIPATEKFHAISAIEKLDSGAVKNYSSRVNRGKTDGGLSSYMNAHSDACKSAVQHWGLTLKRIRDDYPPEHVHDGWSGRSMRDMFVG
jgi:hypothetical protein